MRRGILASREELVALGDRIACKPFDAIYDSLVHRCSLILETSPVNEQQWRRMWDQGSWASAVLAARTAQGRIMDLLIAHHIERNFAFRDRAIEELKALVAWSAWTDPCYENLPADLCTAEAAVAATVGLDWLWEDITEADRLRVIQAIRHKAIEPYRQAVKRKAWWYTCYHSWNAVVNSGCALAGLALGDDEGGAQEAFNLGVAGLKNFFDALGREGGWDEGAGFWGYALRYVLLLGEAAARTIDDRRIFHMRGMDSTGAFPVYFTPNGQAASFGDQPVAPLYGALYLLAKHCGQREIGWWLDHYAYRRDVVTSGWSSAGLGLLFRPLDGELAKPVALAPVKVFHEIGWAAMADRWPTPSFYVAAKTGDLSANHSQRDMNSIQVQVDGEMLLTDPGQPAPSKAYYSDARGEYYQVQARGHNTIIVGQRDHQIDAQGEIIEANNNKNFRYVACDAESACGDTTRFVRHLVMLVDPPSQRGFMLAVVDELVGATAEEAEVYWHSQGQIQLKPAAMTGVITGQKSMLHFALASSVGGTVQTRQVEVQPRHIDHVIVLTIPPSNRSYIVSVFSLKALTKPIEIHPSSGQLLVKAGPATMQFKTQKHYLQLDRLDVE